MIAYRKTPLPTDKYTRELHRGTSKEDFLARLATVPNTFVSEKDKELKRQISSQYCIMLGHKQGYEVVTDAELIKVMGKKIV